jgi:SAM-dependent methyltransferase
MTGEDLIFVKKLFDHKVLDGPFLELGAGYGGPTCRDMVESYGHQYFGTDMEPAKNVDFVGNFENPDFLSGKTFGSILVLNVLEHTFEPIKIIDSCLSVLNNNGKVVIIAPSIWQIHNYPIDCLRILPNFYQEYAKKRKLRINPDFFEYLGYGSINNFLNVDGSMAFPPPWKSKNDHFYGKVIHKIFNTFGRRMMFPSFLAIGCVLEK